MTDVNMKKLEDGARDAVIRGGIAGIKVLLAEAEKHPALTNVAAGAPTPKRGRGRPAKTSAAPEKATKKTAPKGTRGAKRSPEELAEQAKRAFEVIKVKGPVKAEDIAKATGITTKELIIPIKSLIHGGQVKTAGQKRATTYAVAA